MNQQWVIVVLMGSLQMVYADQVILKNGDRITGSIVKKDAKTITIKSDHFGVVTTAWDQVESIKADKALNVVLADGKLVQGTLTTQGGKVEIAGQGTTLAVASADVSIIRDADEQKAYERLQQPRLLDLWAGAGTIGFAGTSGNAKTRTFTAGLTAARITRTDKTSLYFNAIKASALLNGKNDETAQAIRGGLGYAHDLSPRVFVNVFNDYEYDRFQNLDLRMVFGGGAGFHAIRKEGMLLDLLGGGAYNHSRFSTPLIRKAAEAYWGNDFSYKWNAATSLIQSFRMFNNLTDTGNYRMNFDIGATTRLTKWINWNVSLSNRYLSNPAPRRKSNDLLYTSGFGISFAR